MLNRVRHAFENTDGDGRSIDIGDSSDSAHETVRLAVPSLSEESALGHELFVRIAPFDQPLEAVAQLDRSTEPNLFLGLLGASDSIGDEGLSRRLVLYGQR